MIGDDRFYTKTIQPLPIFLFFYTFYLYSHESIGWIFYALGGYGFFYDNLLYLAINTILLVAVMVHIAKTTIPLIPLVIFFFYIVFISFGLLRDDSIIEYIVSPSINMVVWFLPFLLCLTKLRLENVLRIFLLERWILLLILVLFYSFNRNFSYEGTGAQSIAYDSAIVSIMFFLALTKQSIYLKNKKAVIVRELIGFTVSIALCFVFGSRGAIISIFFTILLYFLCFKKYKLLFIIIPLIFASLFSNFFYNVLGYTQLNSRIFEYLQKRTFFSFEGRTLIYNQVINRISENWPFGTGVFSDRIMLTESLGLSTYSHNFFLELMVGFGLFGLLLGILFFLKFFIVLFSNHTSQDLKKIIILFAPKGIFLLQISGSYLLSLEFLIILLLIIDKKMGMRIY